MKSDAMRFILVIFSWSVPLALRVRLQCAIRLMIVILIATHEVCFVNVGDDACATITAALLGAHPILSIEARFSAEIRMALMNNFP